MKQVRVTMTCDGCTAWQDRETVEGVKTVPVDGLTLDLCPEHRDTLAPFLNLVAEWGARPEADSPRRARREVNGHTMPGERPPNRRGGSRARARRSRAGDRPTPPPGSFPCPLCSHPSPTVNALQVHLSYKHHTSAGEVYGHRCPLCGAETVGASGLGNHARRTHDIRHGVPGLFAAAERQGDPLGVIASRAQAMAEGV